MCITIPVLGYSSSRKPVSMLCSYTSVELAKEDGMICQGSSTYPNLPESVDVPGL